MRILGLDLGTASIGWALIDIDSKTFEPLNLVGLGCRIVNLSQDETKSFNSTSGETPCAKRTFNRSARRMNERWKQRRTRLQNLFYHLGMYDRNDTLNSLPPLALWEMRAKAADPAYVLTPKELGRVILHLSAKRGYKHSRLDSNDKKESDYVAGINQHYSDLKESGLTMGQYLYKKLKASEIKGNNGKGSVVTYRTKEGDAKSSNLLPRRAHEEELDTILEAQRPHHPNILTDEVIDYIKHIIFYQRPLKSCKNLVNRDEMFDIKYINEQGKEINCSPRVAPKTSPISQLTRIWEVVNNIRLINRKNKVTNPNPAQQQLFTVDYRKTLEKFELTPDEKKRIANYLLTNDKLTSKKLLEQLGLKQSDGFKSETNLTGGIKGNDTYVKLYKDLSKQPNRDELLKFEPQIDELIDETTGEVRYIVNSDIINQPLYRLWHLIYSEPDREHLRNALIKQFNITEDETLDSLVKLDFKTQGFSNRSVKFMRRILPYLMQGDMYSEACEKAGFRHSDYLTSEENSQRELKDRLTPLLKGSLRQPIVEKILNQMINLVNAILDKFGAIDEIRVELARELKQSKEQRIKATKDISANEKRNKAITPLIEQHGIPANRRTLQKYRMWEETGHKCIYCNKPINVAAFLTGDLSEVEHIIPRSIFFDDSFSNKTCSCRTCNQAKGQMTAYDFMKKQGNEALLEFQKKVEELAEKRVISRTKLKRFLTPGDEIPKDFIERDLQETRFISRKAMEILREVCRNVYASSGKVTDFFRNAWGYNRILESLNLERYEKAGMVNHDGSKSTIRDWTKRLDHRHHAIDALTVSLTRQGYIQRLNTLNAKDNQLKEDVGQNFIKNKSLLEQWAATRPHFSPAEVMVKLSQIGISFKSGKKTTTTARNGKQITEVPRGELHEATIYGLIYMLGEPKPVEKCLENPEIIADPNYRKAIYAILEEHTGNIPAIKKMLKKNPLLSPSGEKVNKLATRRQEFVKREALSSLKANQIDQIIDDAVRMAVMQRFEECGKSEHTFQQSLLEHPLYLSPDAKFPIKRVTRTTGLKKGSMIVARKQGNRPVGYAKSGSNHHCAFYISTDGKITETVISFWIAVKRKKLGLPAIIEKPEEAWAIVEKMQPTADVKEVMETLPPKDSNLMLSLAINDMVVIGLSDEELYTAIKNNDLSALANHLYRVQKLSSSNYHFRHHTHTLTTEDAIAKDSGNCLRLTSVDAIIKNKVTKVIVDDLGNISLLKND